MYKKVNKGLGYHCGEIEVPKEIVRETSQLTIILLISNLSSSVEWEFSGELVTKSQVPSRFGPHRQLFVGRSGAMVDQSYCETVFQDSVFLCSVPGISRRLSTRSQLQVGLIFLLLVRPASQYLLIGYSLVSLAPPIFLDLGCLTHHCANASS